MPPKPQLARRTPCICPRGPRGLCWAVHPAHVSGPCLICAATWDTWQSSPTAGSKTKIFFFFIICVWVIHQGRALCVGRHRAGLFRAVQPTQGWETLPETTRSPVSPHHRRCQAGVELHLSQRASLAFSLLWAKGREFSPGTDNTLM